MPPLTDRHYVFGPSVRECFRASVRSCVLLARFLSNQFTEFHQTLTDNVVEGRYKLTRFRRSRVQGQGHIEVIYLSELLLLLEVCTHQRLGIKVSSGFTIGRLTIRDGTADRASAHDSNSFLAVCNRAAFEAVQSNLSPMPSLELFRLFSSRSSVVCCNWHVVLCLMHDLSATRLLLPTV